MKILGEEKMKRYGEKKHIRYAVFTAAVCFFIAITGRTAQAAYVDVVDGLSPIGYWRLGEPSGTSATDQSGNGITGTYDGVTLGATGAIGGDSDTAIDFDGINDQMITLSSSSLRLTGDMSVSIWVNIDTYPGASEVGPLFTIEADAQTSGVAKMAELAVDQSGDIVYSHEYSPGGSGVDQRTFSSSNLSTDTWYNITVTRDATAEEVTLYIDGDLLDTFSFNNQPEGYGNGTLYLGQYGTDLFDGSIDEIAVFDYELTGQNVTDIYNAAQVPEPATIMILGLGAAVLMRRRK